MHKLWEFFQDGNQQCSMPRLAMFISLFPSTYELIRINDDTALGYYLGAYVCGFVGGKVAEIMKKSPPGGVS